MSALSPSLADGENVLVELGAARWSVSAADSSTVIRRASVSVTAEVGERVRRYGSHWTADQRQDRRGSYLLGRM